MNAVVLTPRWALQVAGGVLCLFAFAVTLLRAQESDHLARITALRAEIAHHDDLYFREAAPEITDYEYDLLKLELRRLEAAAGISSETSETLTDDRNPAAVNRPHGRPMLSLDKAYSDEDVADFWENVTAKAGASLESPLPFSVEPKFDGIAVNVVLRCGRLVSAATRGDGASGEDVTAQVAVIRGLDYEWAFDTADPRIEQIELRGEIYLRDAEFARLNTERRAAGEEPFRHPRSVAAGAVKLDDLAAVAARGLSIVFHGWGEVQPAAAAPASVMAFQHWLGERGLPSVPDASVIAPSTAAELIAAVHAMQDRPRDFPTDGVVIKIDDVEVQRAMGDGPTAPRWALARKFAPPRAETVLRRIAWQVGRTGVLTPVAEFDPVRLDGTTITRASVHNPTEIARRDLRIGDVIWIEKAGEIIPQVAGIVMEQRSKDAPPYVPPMHCPSCASSLHFEESALLCPNWDCDEQVVQRVLHFASRGALGIRGLGPGMVTKLVDADLVRSPADLYALEATQLIALPGVGEKTAQRLLTAIDESRSAALWRVIVGLGLPGVGPTGAKALAAEIDGLSELLDASHRELIPRDPTRQLITRLADQFESR